jgi:hypothetical protein
LRVTAHPLSVSGAPSASAERNHRVTLDNPG